MGKKKIPFTQIIALDENPNLIKKLKFRFARHKSITIIQNNILNSNLKPDSVNKIVTDPPWGYFAKQNMNLFNFYQKMLTVFWSLLKRNGILVLLIGNRDLFDKLLLQFQNQYQLLNQYNILVSGKKASVYKLKKI
ncbi:methyltransferase [Candidatus Beckwithbacteria bacterium]|nr:methyltransferase [Candidatus Beckwithbacteria bacterium]